MKLFTIRDSVFSESLIKEVVPAFAFFSCVPRFLLNVFMCRGVLSACLSVYHMQILLKGQKRLSDSLGPKLQMVVSGHVGARNRI